MGRSGCVSIWQRSPMSRASALARAASPGRKKRHARARGAARSGEGRGGEGRPPSAPSTPPSASSALLHAHRARDASPRARSVRRRGRRGQGGGKRARVPRAPWAAGPARACAPSRSTPGGSAPGDGQAPRHAGRILAPSRRARASSLAARVDARGRKGSRGPQSGGRRPPRRRRQGRDDAKRWLWRTRLRPCGHACAHGRAPAGAVYGLVVGLHCGRSVEGPRRGRAARGAFASCNHRWRRR